MKFSKIMSSTRKWSRTIHRDLSYLFSGMIIIYAISGIVLNHRDKINPNYTVTVEKHNIEQQLPPTTEITKDDVETVLAKIGAEDKYTKHYCPNENTVKVFLKGGSNVTMDLSSNELTYEKLTKKVIIGSFVKLHFNPGRWWTYFSDAFAATLIILVLTGMIMVKGNKGMWGRGGIEFIIGIIIPLLFLLL